MTTTQTAAATRLGWIDSAKGIGIVLVVVGHAWRGLETAGLINNPGLYSVIDGAIYAFHMPFFFFLSGLVIERVLLASSPRALVLSRLQRLIWPLALWTWIFFLFRGLAGSLANKPTDWADFPILPLPPLELFWFLWALFVIQVSLLLAKPLLKTQAYRPRVWALLWLASVAVYLSGPDLGAAYVWIGQAITYAPFFLLGAAVSGLRHRRPAVWIGIVAFVAFLAVVAAAFVLPDRKWAGLVVGGGATLLLCLTVMALEAPVFARPAFRWVGGLGVASLAIYVSHTIFSAAARIVLVKAGVVDLWLHMGVGTLVGLVCPVALFLAARRAGVAGKLGL
jgi:fucose 4-O-acetylase-like acetyltransferase